MIWVRGALLLAAAARLLYFLSLYLTNSGTVRRYHVESAAVLFVVVGIICWLTAPRDKSRRSTNNVGRDFSPAELGEHGTRLPRRIWLLFLAAAVMLYAPARSVGLLSDDVGLVENARVWNFLPVTTSLFRPAPLAAWAMLLPKGGVEALHLFNVVLHGLNGYLASAVVAVWLRSRSAGLLAGALFLTSPLAPEAVVWLSGVFDVSAATFLFLTILIARRYDHPTPAVRAAFVATAFLAVACKETAVVGVPLVLFEAWLFSRLTRQLVVDGGIAIGVIGAYGLARVIGAFGVAAPEMTRFTLQRFFFEVFGAYALPWHSDVTAWLPWLSLAGGVIVVAGFAALCWSKATPSRVWAMGIAWILVPVVPDMTGLVISADLQGGRFLYIGTIGWVALLVGVSRYALAGASRAAFTAALVLLAAAGGVAVRAEIRPWQDAAATRDRVLSMLRTDPRLQSCPRITLTRLPDTVRGAYVFQAGAIELIRDEAQKQVVADASAGCRFGWNAMNGTFELDTTP